MASFLLGKLPKRRFSMKDDEKKPTGFEVQDPKPPVIRSGHMESRKNH